MKKFFSVLSLLSISSAIYAGCCDGGSCGPAKKQEAPKAKTTKEVIQNAYGTVAEEGGVCELFGGGCCGGGQELSEMIGYSKEELARFADANVGAGCGNPVTLGDIKEGFVVVDLGSGAGLDCLLAAKKVGPTGKVIGIDMTDKMLTKARNNAKQYEVDNVEFRKGDIEELPVDSNSVDVVMSNCVINLAPDKVKVFKEAHRVLKAGGKMFVSDVVLLADLTPDQAQDEKLLCACVSGALLKDDYIAKLEETGFTVDVIGEDFEIGKKWFGNDDLPISSLKFVATKK